MIPSLLSLFACLPMPGPQAARLERAALAQPIEEVLAEKRIPGAVVALVVGGETVFLEAFGVSDMKTRTALRPGALLQIGSCTKTFTAELLVLLAEDGVLSLDDPLARWLESGTELPEWTHDVSLRLLATHTSGLPRDPSNRRNVPDSPSVMEPYSIAELYAGLAETRLVAPPGQRWAYSNLGYALLGHALERAAEQPFAALLERRILAPLGMKESGIYMSPEQARRLTPGFWPGDDEHIARPAWVMGEVCAFAGMFSCAADLARYLSAQLATGADAFLSDSARALLTTPVIEIDPARQRSMALGWFVDRAPGLGSLFGHGGEVDSYSACLAYAPEAGFGLVVLANSGGNSAESVTMALMGALPVLLAR